MLLKRNLRKNTDIGTAPVKVCYYKRTKPRTHEVGFFLEVCAMVANKHGHSQGTKICGPQITKQLFNVPNMLPYNSRLSFKNKPTLFNFPGICLGLPETKTVLMSKTQNQLSLHCRVDNETFRLAQILVLNLNINSLKKYILQN
jgi:hypothetical protein